MKPEYTEYDVMCALAEIANGKSERNASLEWVFLGLLFVTAKQQLYHTMRPLVIYKDYLR